MNLRMLFVSSVCVTAVERHQTPCPSFRWFIISPLHPCGKTRCTPTHLNTHRHTYTHCSKSGSKLWRGGSKGRYSVFPTSLHGSLTEPWVAITHYVHTRVSLCKGRWGCAKRFPHVQVDNVVLANTHAGYVRTQKNPAHVPSQWNKVQGK